MKKLLLLIIAFVLYSCAQQSEDAITKDDPRLPDDGGVSVGIKHTPGNFCLKETDAALLAKAIITNFNWPETRGIDVEAVRSIYINEALPLTKTAEDALMYVVNLSNNKGFILLSSDIRVPVLAISDGGPFEKQIQNPGMKMFLKGCIPFIEQSIKNYNEIIESRSGIQSEWVSLPPFANAVYLHEYEDRYEDLYFEREAAYPGDISALYEKFHVDPLIKTAWHQMAPYNSLVPGKETPYPAGCITMAAAQILAYHRWPDSSSVALSTSYGIDRVKYNYAAMTSRATAPQISDLNARYHISVLVRDLYRLFNIQGSDDGSSPAGNNDHAAFKALGQWGFVTGGWNDLYNREEMIKSILRGWPILMTGRDSDKGSGHAWIVDGYDYIGGLYRNHYTVWGKSNDPNFRQTVTTKHYFSKPSISYHCNWGWTADIDDNTNYNGWYNEGVWKMQAAKSWDSNSSNASSRVKNYDFGTELRVIYSLRKSAKEPRE